MPDHFIKSPESQMGHQLAHFLSYECHEGHYIVRITGKSRTKRGVLSSYAYRAGVQMANAHHHAAHCDKGRRRKPELFGSEQRSDHHVAAGFELAVNLDGDAAAKIVQHQDLVRFSEPEFPWDSCVCDAGQWRGSGATVVPADQDNIRVSFGDSSRNGSHADFSNQFDAYAGVVVRAFEIVNELSQVFDRVYVVMRWWRYQADTGRRVAHFGYPGVNFVPRELPAFARFCALRHLDLKFPRIDKVVAGHTKSR